jgi:soluble lytic murein transglycosylase
VKRLVVFGVVLAALAAVACVVLWVSSGSGGVAGPGWYNRTSYPLKYTDVIRSSSRRRDLDPTLVAAIIYAESQFDPTAVSDQGAVGLMQVLPTTATQIAGQSGGATFTTADLEVPAVNVRYGCYYLRTVLDQFGGDTLAAVAAYNAGAGAVSQWVAAARADGHELRAADIPFAETRGYVSRVFELRRIYRKTYGDQLGLSR